MGIVEKIRNQYASDLKNIGSKEEAFKIITEEGLDSFYRQMPDYELTPEFLNENELVFWHDIKKSQWCFGITSERRSVSTGIKCYTNYVEALKELIFSARLKKASFEYEKEQLKKQYGIE